MTEEQRNEWADRYYAEMKGVAEEFARQINRRYYRGSNCWSTTSSFLSTGEQGLFHPLRLNRKPVKLDVSKLECSDAVEMAWDIEETWNKKCAPWDEWEEFIDTYYEVDHDLWDRYTDYLMADVDNTLKEIGKAVERWIDSMECYVWSDEFDEFVDEMEHCAA